MIVEFLVCLRFFDGKQLMKDFSLELKYISYTDKYLFS